METEFPRFSPPPARSSLRIFLGSLWAFMLREIRNRFGTSRLGYFWALLDPVATTGFFIVMHAVVRGSDSLIYGENPIFFFVFGVVPYFMFQYCVTAQTGALGGARGLFSYRQIRPIDVLVARVLIEWLQLTVVFVAFALVCWVIRLPLQVEDLARLVAGGAGLLLLGFAAGLCFELYAVVFPDLRRVFALITRPLFFLSGPFYTIEMIPEEYRIYLLWNPVLHLVDLTRDAAMIGYDSPASVLYVAICTLGFLFVGLAGYRRHMHQLL